MPTTTLSDGDLHLLRRVFGIRRRPDGQLDIPLRHTWRAFCGEELAPIWFVFPYAFAITRPAEIRQGLYPQCYLLVVLALYIGAILALVVRRRLVTSPQSGVGALMQKGQSYQLPITDVICSQLDGQPFVLLDGVFFALAPRGFVRRQDRDAAIQLLRNWIVPTPRSSTDRLAGEAVFLATVDVTAVEAGTVTFRTAWSKVSSYILWGTGSAFALVCCLPWLGSSGESDGIVIGVEMLASLVLSAGTVVFLQISRGTVSLSSGSVIHIKGWGDNFNFPAGQARVALKEPDRSNEYAPALAEIQLKFPLGSVTVCGSWTTEDNGLEDIVRRMNTFLWGSRDDPAMSRPLA